MSLRQYKEKLLGRSIVVEKRGHIHSDKHPHKSDTHGERPSHHSKEEAKITQHSLGLDYHSFDTHKQDTHGTY